MSGSRYLVPAVLLILAFQAAHFGADMWAAATAIKAAGEDSAIVPGLMSLGAWAFAPIVGVVSVIEFFSFRK
jgi:hypothetical protein